MKSPLTWLLLVLPFSAVSAAEPDAELLAQEATSGADASNPTAAVNFQDLRFRYFDLDRGADTQSFETEGAFMVNPRFKVTNELRYVNTDRSGKSEQDFQEFKLRAFSLTDVQPFGVKAKMALGAEWLKDLGDLEDGTGTGADMIAPLFGIGWVPNDLNFIVTLVQYFHSYDTDNALDEDVRVTGPRLIWIRKLPSIGGWFKADLKMAIDHEDDEDFSQTMELPFGRMLSRRWGVYGELLLGDDVLDTREYDMGAGIGIRYVY